jgi:hypothetical protein
MLTPAMRQGNLAACRCADGSRAAFKRPWLRCKRAEQATEEFCIPPQVGFRGANSSEFRPLSWRPSEAAGAKRGDGTWGCPDLGQPYPAMHHSLVHPCTSSSGACCGLAHAAFNLRFQSFVAAPQGMLLMAYEVPLPCSHLRHSVLFLHPSALARSPPHGFALHAAAIIAYGGRPACAANGRECSCRR